MVNLALFFQGGRILIHGVDGLNRSAAVVIAYLMKSHPCLLEEAFFYVQVLRPFIRVLAFKPVFFAGKFNLKLNISIFSATGIAWNSS